MLTLFCPTCQRYLGTALQCVCGYTRAAVPTQPIAVSTGLPMHGKPLLTQDKALAVFGYGVRGGVSGGVLALDAHTLALVWQYEVGACVERGLTLFGPDRLLIGDGAGVLHNLDLVTRQSIKSRPVAGAITQPPLLWDEANVIVATDAGVVAQIDPRFGKVVNAVQIHARIAAPPVRWGRHVLVTALDGNLYAFDPVAGTLETLFSAGSGLYVAPVFIDKLAIIATQAGEVIALEMRSLSQINVRWRFKAGRTIRYAPTLAGRLLHVGSQDHFLYALDASTGALLWKFDAENGLTTSSCLTQGLIVVGNNKGWLLAMDATTHELVWRYSVELPQGGAASVAGLPAVVFEGITVREDSLLFSSYNGQVFSLPFHMGQWEWATTRAIREQKWDEAAALMVFGGRAGAVQRAGRFLGEHARHQQAAQLFEANGDRLEAAQAYEQLAQSTRRVEDWYVAANAWRALNLVDKARQCQEQAALIGNQPLLKIDVTSLSPLKVGEYSLLRLAISNQSPHKARAVQVVLSSPELESVEVQSFPELSQAVPTACEFRIRPTAAGDARLNVIISYQDVAGRALSNNEWTQVLRVAAPDQAPILMNAEKLFAQPAQIHVQGTYIAGNVDVKGDFVGRDRSTTHDGTESTHSE